MLNKVRLMMMIKRILLSKIGWPSVGGVWGASANNATGCLTHSRTHARTHPRTHCSNQVSELLSRYVDDQYHLTQVLLSLKTVSLIIRLFSEMSIFLVLQTRNRVNRDFGLCSRYRRLLLMIKHCIGAIIHDIS